MWVRIQVNGTEMEVVGSFKFLGIYISKHLILSIHIHKNFLQKLRECGIASGHPHVVSPLRALSVDVSQPGTGAVSVR